MEKFNTLYNKLFEEVTTFLANDNKLTTVDDSEDISEECGDGGCDAGVGQDAIVGDGGLYSDVDCAAVPMVLGSRRPNKIKKIKKYPY